MRKKRLPVVAGRWRDAAVYEELSSLERTEQREPIPVVSIAFLVRNTAKVGVLSRDLFNKREPSGTLAIPAGCVVSVTKIKEELNENSDF